MEMIECSVKTELNGKSIIFHYGIFVDDLDTNRSLVNRRHETRRTEKRMRR